MKKGVGRRLKEVVKGWLREKGERLKFKVEGMGVQGEDVGVWKSWRLEDWVKGWRRRWGKVGGEGGKR